jgi:hypothetical protein
MPPPKDLSHVKAPWEPNQAIKKWQADGMKRIKEAAAREAKAPHPPAAAEKHEKHHYYAEDWLRWATEKMMWQKGDTNAEKIDKFAFIVIFGPIVIGMLAIWGNFLDKLNHIGVPVDAILAPVPLDAMRERYDPPLPNVPLDGGTPEETSTSGRSVAHETVPPAPPPAPSRERNKCSSPSRGTK